MRDYVIEYEDWPWLYTIEIINVEFGTFRQVAKRKMQVNSTPVVRIYELLNTSGECTLKNIASCYGVYLGGYDNDKRMKHKIVTSLIHLSCMHSEIVPEEHGGIEAIVDDYCPSPW